MKTINPEQEITNLKAEIATLKTVISMLPGHVYWKDYEGFYMGCNNNMAKVFKLDKPEDIVGKKLHDIIGAEYADKVEAIDSEIIHNRGDVTIEEQGFDDKGKPATYLTQKSIFLDDKNNLKGLLGVSFNITERKLIEKKLKIAKQKAEAASRAKTRFLAMVSHELRTPLTSILGFANLLNKKISALKKKQYILYLINSGSYLLSLINNLLDYSRLETNKFELMHSPINLKKLMEDVVSMLSETAKAKKLKLILDYDLSAPTQMLGDAQAIQQIVINLAGNAIKFTENGYIAIRVRCLAKTAEAAQLEIVLEDTGIGIPSNEQKSIFKRFYQLDNVYTRNTSLTGTGLGLAIVKKLVTLMGGKIKVESTPNKGSIFYFIITLAYPPQNISKDSKAYTPSLDTESDNQPSSPVKSLLAKKIVLLVEDDALIQIIHQKMLEELNCNVDIVGDAMSALKVIDKKFDILFIDIGLPEIDGFKLIKTIREQSSINSTTKIVALTGYSEKEEYQKCLKAGADLVAIKPISKNDLNRILKDERKSNNIN